MRRLTRVAGHVSSRCAFAFVFLLVAVWAMACGAAPLPPEPGTGSTGSIKVVAIETFLSDLAQNVAGDRLTVESLMPPGADPHAFELTPSDAAKVAASNLLIVNGAGFEPSLETTLQNIGERAKVVEASAGLVSRTGREGEHAAEATAEAAGGDDHDDGDPHFWLDPTLAVKYVENIRDALSAVDPQGASEYAKNAAAYIQKLRELDAWIADRVAVIPLDKRLLVTNHESFGYYADRYGFRVVGTLIPSVSTGAAPSAQQLARLVEAIKQAGVRAVFLETGANADLAEQVATETGITVVTQLYTHSLTGPDGPAPTYIDMMKFDTETIVSALE